MSVFTSRRESRVVGFGIVNALYLKRADGTPDFRFFFATLMGIILALIIGRLTEHFTATEKKPVTDIAYASRTGAATLLLAGLAEGMESSVWALVAICATIFGSMAIFGGDLIMSFYGIALARSGIPHHHRFHPCDGHLRPDFRQRQRHRRTGG